jgi:hypothetical protein
MTDEEKRLAILEQKFESWHATDARLKAIEESIKKFNPNPKSSLRDWIQALSPFVTAIAVFIVGFVLKDSVSLALQREDLDLKYVKDVRDLIEGFDAAKEQSSADANAIALAMYGRFAIVPLIERLQGGDVAQLAAQRGLSLVGANEPAAVCAAFTRLLHDPARRYIWQTHKVIIRLIAVSECVPNAPTLEGYLTELDGLGDPQRLAAFSQRFSNAEAFDAEGVDTLRRQTDQSLAILKLSRERAEGGEKAWWQ